MKKAAFVTKLNQQIGTEFFAEDTEKLNDGYPILKWQTEGSSEGGNTTTPEDPEQDRNQRKLWINQEIQFTVRTES